MFVQQLITVFALGLSVEGLVLCPFVSFGLTMTDRMTGVRFVAGRLLGIVLFGLLVSWAGTYVHFDARWVNLAFGLLVIGLGTHRLLGRPTPSARCAHARRAAGHGFALGFLRGLLNPGRKYIYLAPLLIGAGVLPGLMTSFVFGVSSSAYLLLGVFAAGALRHLTTLRPHLERAGGVVLILIGIVFGSKAFGQLEHERPPALSDAAGISR